MYFNILYIYFNKINKQQKKIIIFDNEQQFDLYTSPFLVFAYSPYRLEVKPLLQRLATYK